MCRIDGQPYNTMAEWDEEYTRDHKEDWEW